MNPHPKPQDDSALDFRNSKSVKSSTLAKSMMQTPIPKIKENIFVKKIDLCEKADFKQQSHCTICFRPYTTGFRRHHCRVCANACCDDCSLGKINSERACDLCYVKYSNQQDLERKDKMIATLERLCGYLMYNRVLKSEELEKIKLASKEKEKSQQLDPKTKQDSQKQQNSLKELKNQAMALSEKKKNLFNQLNLMMEKNKKLDEEMKLLERDNEDQ